MLAGLSDWAWVEEVDCENLGTICISILLLSDPLSASMRPGTSRDDLEALLLNFDGCRVLQSPPISSAVPVRDRAWKAVLTIFAV